MADPLTPHKRRSPCCKDEATRYLAERATVPERLHRLLMPPHPGEVYNSSALCSCGDFQYDADSPGDLSSRYGDILRTHTEHVHAATVPAPVTPYLQAFIDAVDAWLAYFTKQSVGLLMDDDERALVRRLRERRAALSDRDAEPVSRDDQLGRGA